MTPFFDDGLRKYSRGGGAVARHIRRLARHLFHHLRAHVLELVLELDLLGDSDAILGDARGAVALIKHDISALWAERDLDGIGENIDTAHHLIARVLGEFDVFGCHGCLLQILGSDTKVALS